MRRSDSAFWEWNSVYNKNTSWVDHPAVWVCYLAFIIAARGILVWFPVTNGIAWTIVHVAHAVLTWFLFHWQKGVPYGDVVDKQQGKFDRLTMWEQMDLGVQFTPSRKFFTIVPILLFIITTHYNELQKPLTFWVNFGFFLLLIVSKLPSMHRVRVFGINKE